MSDRTSRRSGAVTPRHLKALPATPTADTPPPPTTPTTPAPAPAATPRPSRPATPAPARPPRPAVPAGGDPLRRRRTSWYLDPVRHATVKLFAARHRSTQQAVYESVVRVLCADGTFAAACAAGVDQPPRPTVTSLRTTPVRCGVTLDEPTWLRFVEVCLEHGNVEQRQLIAAAVDRLDDPAWTSTLLDQITQLSPDTSSRAVTAAADDQPPDG